MRKLFVIFCILLCPFSLADDEIKPAVQNPLVIPQNISYEECTKIFNLNREKLFYLTLVSINMNRFNIDEIQTSNGYIMFTVNRNKYIATVSKVDNSNSVLKITPCNNVYNFPPGILVNTFKYIELNKNNNGKIVGG